MSETNFFSSKAYILSSIDCKKNWNSLSFFSNHQACTLVPVSGEHTNLANVCNCICCLLDFY